MQRALERGDMQAVRFWWAQYQPVAEHCADVPPEAREQEGCWCVQLMVDQNGAWFHHLDGTQPDTLRGRLSLAGARCREAGLYPDANDVDPHSPFGRCVQSELGGDVVLGQDVHLAYTLLQRPADAPMPE